MAGYMSVFWLYFFFVILFIGLLEMILSQQFNRFYFRTGIPLYRKRYPFYGPPLDTLTVQILERSFTNYSFKSFNSNECAFQKTIRGELNWGIMRGISRLSPKGDCIIVKGYASWLPLMFFLWLIALPFISGDVSWSMLFSQDFWSIFYSPFFLLMYLVLGLSYVNEICTFELIGKHLAGEL